MPARAYEGPDALPGGTAGGERDAGRTPAAQGAERGGTPAPRAHPVRRLVRGAGFAFWTLGLELLWLLGWPLARALGRSEPWRAFIFSRWGRAVLRALRVRVRSRGAAPPEPGLVVCNHVSYVDVAVLAAAFPCAFVAKREVRSWPLLGLLAASMGTLFVDRESKRDVVRVARAIEERVARGQTVVVFPEGTSSPGTEVLPFRPSLLAPFARLGRPVRYAAIRYETSAGDPPASRSVAWWGDMAFPPHFLHLLGLSHIEATLVLGSEGLRDPDRKRLAARLQEAVAECFEPMSPPGTMPVRQHLPGGRMSDPSAHDAPAGACAPLIHALCAVLDQGLSLVESLDPALYSAVPEGLATSGAGPHMRHALDFCRRFVEGLETGRIDYDRRERDPREEVDPAYAAERLRAVRDELLAVQDEDPGRLVDVRHDVPAALIREATAGGAPWTRSSLGRELLFVLSHTIHHYALIAMALRHHGVDPGPEFGVAPSTLRYWAEEGSGVPAST